MNSTLSKSTLPTTVREEFPILGELIRGKRLVYLDNAATSQKPLAVIESQSRYYQEQNANIHRGVHHLSQVSTAEYDRARELVRGFLNAEQTAEVIFTKGCTESVNLVASGMTFGSPNKDPRLKLSEGDAILVSEMEHHSNIVPWQLAAERTGAKVISIPISDEGEIDQEIYLALLKSHRPKIVAIKHVCNALGTINPVKWMIQQAHAYGSLVLVDGAQAGPHLSIDVQEIGADFYTLSCHKIYAPTGVGVLYGRREFLEALPPYQGGGDMIRTVSFEGSTYAELPAKFEAGTPNIAGVIGLGAAIKWLTDLGNQISHSGESGLKSAMDAIHAHEVLLTRRAEELLRDIPGVRIVGEASSKAGIVSFVIDGVHPHDVGTILDMDGIAVRAGHHCCMPLMKRLGVPATSRASFALYSTIEDAETLAEGVKKVKEMFA